MNYRIEMRIVTDDGKISIAGITSKPQTIEQIKDDSIFDTIQQYLQMLVNMARMGSHPTTDPKRTDKDASFQLRHFAELMDAGKFVVSVTSREVENDRREITLLLDPNKS